VEDGWAKQILAPASSSIGSKAFERLDIPPAGQPSNSILTDTPFSRRSIIDEPTRGESNSYVQINSDSLAELIASMMRFECSGRIRAAMEHLSVTGSKSD
jgi:hypothetical protein